jgi:hypothetical protein
MYRALYIFATLTVDTRSKAIVRIVPTYLPLLFETSFTCPFCLFGTPAQATHVAMQAASREILVVPLPTPPFTRPPPLTCGTHMSESFSTLSTSMADASMSSHRPSLDVGAPSHGQRAHIQWPPSPGLAVTSSPWPARPYPVAALPMTGRHALPWPLPPSPGRR